MKLTILGLVVAATLVKAQSNSTLIPSNITSSCSSFLDSINTDDQLSNCVQPLLNATASFSPTSGANLTDSDISSALSSICATNAGCSDSTIRTWLTNFYSSCQAELTGSGTYNPQVRELYDVLYVVQPLKSAVCAIDSSNQQYCVKEIQSSETGSSSSSNNVANSTSLFAELATTMSPVTFAAENLYVKIVASAGTMTKRFLTYLSPRDGASQTPFAVITPNTTTYRTTNLPFLFLQPDMKSSDLCTPCTREVFVSYIKWESQQPYALGLSQSPILGGQGALWNAVNATCGATYTNAVVSEVGAGNFAASGIGAASATTSMIPGLAVGMALLAAAASLF